MEALPPWIVLLGAIVGGGGIAAIGGVVTGYIKDRRTANQGDRSVAMDEVDRAIPGLSEVIQQLRTHIHDQADRISSQAGEIAKLTRRNQELIGTVWNLELRVDELEREVGHE